MIALVTGATSGIGKETARALAAGGTHVVMVSRTKERGERVAAEIGKAGQVDLLLADLASLQSVRDLAAQVLERYPRLDALISNAGVFRTSRHVSADGFEETFAVNHLAPFLLTNLLLPRLLHSAPARVVIVASAAHGGQRLDFDDLQSERSYKMWRAYGRSKLANIMFTYALARRNDQEVLTANCLHPGFVRSSLGSGNHVPMRPVMFLLTPFTITPRVAAESPVRLATSPDLAGVTSKYFDRLRESFSSKASYDVDAQERLWLESRRLTGLSS